MPARLRELGSSTRGASRRASPCGSAMCGAPYDGRARVGKTGVSPGLPRNCDARPRRVEARHLRVHCWTVMITRDGRCAG